MIMGMISTSTCDIAERSWLSVAFMCGRFTTASSPRLRGCSGPEMVDIRSAIIGVTSTCDSNM